MRNHEVTAAGLLLGKDGNLREPGWSRSQVQKYKRSMIRAPKFRIKEWDYYLVVNDGFAAAFTISDDGYIGLQSVSLLVFGEKPWEHTETVLNPFPMGRLHLPEDSASGVTEFQNKRLQMRFEPKDRKRHITCHFENFMDGKALDADIVLEQPQMDSIVIATPWPKKHVFYYNQKINCMRAAGELRFDGKVYRFDPASDFGTLDWGRVCGPTTTPGSGAPATRMWTATPLAGTLATALAIPRRPRRTSSSGTGRHTSWTT